MSMPVLDAYGDEVTTELGATSPFAPVSLSNVAAPMPAPPPGQVLHSPFAEAAVAAGDGARAAEATDAPLAELEDPEFTEVLAALADEAAARHLKSVGTTLERRLLDDGAETWPVDGKVELYELLPG